MLKMASTGLNAAISMPQERCTPKSLDFIGQPLLHAVFVLHWHGINEALAVAPQEKSVPDSDLVNMLASQATRPPHPIQCC
jgi:hypothetical protein